MRNDRPKFSGRVQRDKIQRLYESDVRGMLDEDLLNDVGIALLTRIESIQKAAEATSGRAWCPLCERKIEHNGEKDQLLRCDGCDWQLTWGEFHNSIKGKHLSAGGIKPFLREYMGKYPNARSAKQRMILIDILLHRFHWELEQRLTRPAAGDLIGGKPAQILAFLDSLAYGENSTPGVLAAQEEWRQKMAKHTEYKSAQVMEREARRQAKALKERSREERKRMVRESKWP